MSQKKYFKEKIFIVTGASSGIGKATSIEAARQGANVVIAARNIEKLKDVAKVIESLGVECLAVQTDVSKREDAENLINKTIEKFGKIDVLINNAGISMRAMFDEIEIDVFKKVIDINFMGTVYCTRYAIKHILEQKGSVVGVLSVSGFTPLGARTAYVASKYAMSGFLESLRIENIKRGLHVLISYPGFTESEIRKHALMADGSEQGNTPRHEEKMMTSEEVAVSMMKAIRKRKRVQILTLMGRSAWILNKISPWWVHKAMYRGISKEPDSPLPKWK
ncbi:MAG: SDR family oxidoreductase [Bacteroidales bacterium]|nr:SDR family oxidoreductase [Bacteroidales bacterium]